MEDHTQKKRTQEEVVITGIEFSHTNTLGRDIYVAALADGRVAKTHMSEDSVFLNVPINVIMLYDGNYFMLPNNKHNERPSNTVKERKSEKESDFSIKKIALEMAARNMVGNSHKDILDAATAYYKFLTKE